MAVSPSLCNSISFFLPSKPSPLTCTARHLLSYRPVSSQIHLQTQKYRDGFVALSAGEDYNYSESLSSELASVICPSVAFSNTMFFKSAYNVQVIVDENEPEERLLNRFRREVMKAGIIQECKRRRFFENKQDEKKRRTRDAAKRNRRRRPQARFVPQNKQDVPTTKKSDEEEDNWDLPEAIP